MTNTQALVPVQTTPEDDMLVAMWLTLKSSEHTQRAYAHSIDAFRLHTNKTLASVGLADLLEYLSTVSGSDSTKALHTNALKSLFTYCSELFPTQFPINFGKALKAPKQHSKLAQRILSEADMLRMIDRTANKRDHAMLRLMYHSGLRVSEIVGLKWEDIRTTDNGAVLDVWGKGEKQRFVLISHGVYDELASLDGRFLGNDRYVFQSRKSKGGVFPMDASQVDRIVIDAARRAGIEGNVSAHWLRHANASHALDNGAPIHVVQQSLGHASLVTTTRYAHIKPGAGSSQFIKV
jgi:site-specific recombinase XerD